VGPNPWKVALIFEELAVPYISKVWDTYNKNHLISFDSPQERNLLRRWIHFQIAFQGPSLNNVFFFTHIEPNIEAHAHLVKDWIRILHMLDQALIGKAWLVGSKCSAADLIFVPVQMTMDESYNDSSRLSILKLTVVLGKDHHGN
jgi:glutathione S-transferase